MLSISNIIKNVHGRYDGDLIHYYRLVMNAPNMYAPYHNVRHMLHVLWESYEGGLYMGLDKEQMRELLIAALMHDYNHLGRKASDDENISRAIQGLNDNVLKEDLRILEFIHDAIKATQFPYVIDSDRCTIVQKILRDADQAQTFSNVWIQSIRYDLSKELEITPKKMLEFQIPYLKGLKFHTVWGETKFGPMIPVRIKEIEEMLELEKEIEN